MDAQIGELERLLMQDDDDDHVPGDLDHLIGDLERILLTPATSPPSNPLPPSSYSRADNPPDCLSKEQIRKFKNGEASMRYRERRRAYLKELEMRTQYFEAECKRLHRLLYFSYAEIQMLRNATACSGCTAKAESAVLLESLLLGSLLWLLATTCLLPLPQEAAVSLQSGNKYVQLLPPRTSKVGKLTQLRVTPSFLSKRCTSSRTKMKLGLLESCGNVCRLWFKDLTSTYRPESLFYILFFIVGLVVL